MEDLATLLDALVTAARDAGTVDKECGTNGNPALVRAGAGFLEGDLKHLGVRRHVGRLRVHIGFVHHGSATASEPEGFAHCPCARQPVGERQPKCQVRYREKP